MAADNAWLAHKLREHEQAIQALARGTRLPNSSLQNGETITLSGDGGVLEVGDGGLNYVDGPPPPRAAAPTLESGIGTVFVSWDGTFAPPKAVEGEEADSEDAPEAPLNFARVQVHASTDPEESAWGADTLQGEILAPSGGTVVIRGGDLEDTVYVCLITEARDGQIAPPSDLADIVITGIDLSSIAEELDAANLDLSNLDGDMFAANAELDAAKILFKNLDMDIIHTDDGTLRDALEEARRLAQEQAEQAKNSAIEAAKAADATTFWLPEEVAGYEPQHWGEYAPQNPKEGDLALVPNLPGLGGGFISYRYRSGAWVEASDAIAKAAMEFTGVALSKADEAQQTANGKNKITRSLDNPPVVYTGAVNDLWWRLSSMGSGGRVISQWRWNGSVWVSELVGDETIANLNAAKISAGYLDAARIRAQSISVDKLIVSSNTNLISDPQFASAGAGWAGALNGPISPGSEFVNVPDGPGGVFAPVARISVPSNDFSAFYSKSWPQFPENGSDPLQGMQGTEVRPGESYRFVMRARVVQRPTSGVGGLRLRGGFSKNGGSRQWPLLTDNLLTDAPLGEWRDVTGVWAHPGGTEPRNRLSVGVHAISSAGAIFEVAFVGMYAMTTSELIVDGAVTTRALQANAVTAGKIAAGAIEAQHIKADSITAGSIAANAIGARAIAAEAIEAQHIAAGAITTVQLAAGSVTAEKIVGLSITAEKLAALSISTEKIVAGAVVADKIAANAVTADKIAALAVTADKIAANAVTADKIAANSVTAGALQAGAIDGQVITGATIRTASAGARVELTQNGLKQYNASGQTIVDLTGGSAEVRGSLYSGPEGEPRVWINSALFGSDESPLKDRSGFDSGSGAGVLFGADNKDSGIVGYGAVSFKRWGSSVSVKSLIARGPDARSSQDPGPNGAYLALTANDAFLRSRDGDQPGGTQTRSEFTAGAVVAGVYQYYRSSPEASPALNSYLEMGNNSVTLRAFATSGPSSTAPGMTLRHNGDVQLHNVYSTTTSDAPNVYISNTGKVYRSSSSRSTKVNERTIPGDDYAKALLSIEFKGWRDAVQVRQHEALIAYQAENPYAPAPISMSEGVDEPREYVGAVAEDFIEAGLPEFVSFDQYGNPDGLMYDRIGPALIPIVRDQRDRIQALEEELEQIKEIINA